MSGFVTWAQTVDWQAWAMFAQAAAIAVAAWWARSSISSFLEQKSASRRFDLAVQALRISYRAEESLRSIRLRPPPNIFGSIGLNEEDVFIEHSMKIANDSIQMKNAFFAEIDEIAPELTIYFDRSLSEALRSLQVPLRDIYWAAQSEARHRRLTRQPGQSAAAQVPAEHQKIINGHPDDDFDQEITNIIKRIEDEIKKSGVDLRK
jgi:hypothetical protein